MIVSQVYIVDDLRKKVQLLAEKLKNQKAENSVLLKEKEELTDKMKEKDNKINELKKLNNTLKLSKAFTPGSGGLKEAKVEINNIVREIDKCIALLNR